MTETEICNMALGRIGSKAQLTNVDTDTSVEAVKCRLHYDQTRDALLRSFEWSFANTRANLTAVDTPAFEWDYAFKLPDDFLRMKTPYEMDGSYYATERYTIEGDCLLTNDSTASIRYVKKVTDPNEFDSLFIEVLVLRLALKLLATLAGGGELGLYQMIGRELGEAEHKARMVCRAEVNTTGRSDWAYERQQTGLINPED